MDADFKSENEGLLIVWGFSCLLNGLFTIGNINKEESITLLMLSAAVFLTAGSVIISRPKLFFPGACTSGEKESSGNAQGAAGRARRYCYHHSRLGTVSPSEAGASARYAKLGMDLPCDLSRLSLCLRVPRSCRDPGGQPGRSDLSGEAAQQSASGSRRVRLCSGVCAAITARRSLVFWQFHHNAARLGEARGRSARNSPRSDHTSRAVRQALPADFGAARQSLLPLLPTHRLLRHGQRGLDLVFLPFARVSAGAGVQSVPHGDTAAAQDPRSLRHSQRYLFAAGHNTEHYRATAWLKSSRPRVKAARRHGARRTGTRFRSEPCLWCGHCCRCASAQLPLCGQERRKLARDRPDHHPLCHGQPAADLHACTRCCEFSHPWMSAYTLGHQMNSVGTGQSSLGPCREATEGKRRMPEEMLSEKRPARKSESDVLVSRRGAQRVRVEVSETVVMRRRRRLRLRLRRRKCIHAAAALSNFWTRKRRHSGFLGLRPSQPNQLSIFFPVHNPTQPSLRVFQQHRSPRAYCVRLP
ncbi:hypothetical protein L1887_53506 [Cichorium endivia]|nr:hypothetical protein L1887_53506 [Cichorium endivia]